MLLTMQRIPGAWRGRPRCIGMGGERFVFHKKLASSLSNFFNVLDGTSPSRRSNTTRRDVIDKKGPKLNLIIALPFCTSCGYLVLALRGYPSFAKQFHSGFFDIFCVHELHV